MVVRVPPTEVTGEEAAVVLNTLEVDAAGIVAAMVVEVVVVMAVEAVVAVAVDTEAAVKEVLGGVTDFSLFIHIMTQKVHHTTI